MNKLLVTPPARLLPALLLALGSVPAFAFQPLITDDTGTQGAGGNQLEFGVSEDREKFDGTTTRTRTLPIVYTRGLADPLDVFIGIDHQRIRSDVPDTSASGRGNPVIGLKWRFYENEGSKTSLAVKPEIALPVSGSREARGLGTGKTSHRLTAILTQELGFGAVHANLGVARDRFRDPGVSPNVSTTHASVAPVWDVAEGWKLAADLGTDSARGGGQRVRANYFEIGAIYSPNKDLDFALGLIRTSDNQSPKTTVNSATAGVTWRFR